MSSVELTDSIRGVVQVRCRFPGPISFRPTLPVHEILHSLALVAQVNNVLHLVFLFAILHHVGRTWGSHRLAQQAFAIWLDAGDVDDRMDVHRAGKMEFNSISPDQLCDGIGTKPSFRQLLGGVREMEVIGGKPDLILNGICQGVQAGLIHLCEDAGVCLDQVVISVGEAICELLGSRGLHCLVFHAHMGGVSTSELEWGELHAGMLMVVNGELGESQPFRPMVLFFSTEEAEVLLNLPIHDFSLTIRLQVMRS